MEGDAGASQLNPTDADDSLRTEVTTEDSSESEAGADQTGEAVTTEDSSESEAGADPTDTEDSADAEAAPRSKRMAYICWNDGASNFVEPGWEWFTCWRCGALVYTA